MDKVQMSGATSKKRVDWIDFAKGIAILLVIISHCVGGRGTGDLIRGLIFSFHMPLFFVLSCITFRCSQNIDEFLMKTKKAAIHLLVPALVIVVLRIIMQDAAKDIEVLISVSYWKKKLMTLLFSSGYITTIGGTKIAALGIPWFLVVLFLSRTLFDYLHLTCISESLAVNCCLLSMAGVLFGRREHMPLSMDIVMAIMPLLLIGDKLKNYSFEKHAVRKLFAFGILWLLTFFIIYDSGAAYLEFAIRRYPVFPLCYITAICGTLMICEGSVLATKLLGKLSEPVLYLGKNSLYMLGIHCMDGLWSSWWKGGVSTLRRVAADILVFCMFMLLRRLLKEIYKKQKNGDLLR